MINLNTHKPTTSLDIKHSALYKKALIIYALSRKLNENNDYKGGSAHSLNHLSVLEEIILLSIRLPYTIALTQTSSNYYTKTQASHTILKNIELLKEHCKSLKNVCHTNKHISLMTKELHSFTNAFYNWHIILTQQN